MRLRRIALLSFMSCVSVLAVLYAMFVPRVLIGDIRDQVEMGLPGGSSTADVKRWIKSHPDIHYYGEVVDDQTQRVLEIHAYAQHGSLLGDF
jgi:hypothetical protein